MKLTISQPIETFGSTEFIEHVRSLRSKKAQQGSKAVPGVAILRGKRLIVKITREPKVVTEYELCLLASEYALELTALRELLTSRKVVITNEAGEVTNAKPKKAHARSSKSRRALAPKAEL